MCGRFNLVTNIEDLSKAFAIPTVPPQYQQNFQSRFNIAPTQPISAVVENSDGIRELTFFLWGLIPSWSKDTKFASRMINARSETVHEKPSFRAAFKRRRCLVPMTGFYEWQKLPSGKKQPTLIEQGDNRELFAVAGLWETWQGIQSCTLLTGKPNDVMAPIHDRMPIILAPEEYDLWLDVDAPLPAVKSLFEPYSAELLHTTPVSTYVNKPANEGPACIEPVSA